MMKKYTLRELKQNLEWAESTILRDIINLSKQTGFCYAADSFLEEEYNKSNSTIQRHLKSLENQGYIRREVIKDKFTRKVKGRRIYLTFELVESNDEMNKPSKSKPKKVKKVAKVSETIINAFELRFNRKPQAKLEKLEKAYGEERLLQAIVATDNSKGEIKNPESYIATCIKNLVINVQEANLNIQSFKTNVKRVIRQEIVPDWLKEAQEAPNQEVNYSADDLSKIERMKRLQREILGFSYGLKPLPAS